MPNDNQSKWMEKEMHRQLFLKMRHLQMKWWDAIMKHKRVIQPRFFVFVMAVVIVVFSCTYYLEGNYLMVQNQYIAELEAAKEAAMLKNAEIERKIEFTKTNEYIERVAREDLGLLKPGQIRFVQATQ